MSDKTPKKKATKKSSSKRKPSHSSSPKSRNSSGSPKPGRSTPKPSRPPPPPPPPPTSLCTLHRKDLRFFCETREEPICEDCLAAPPYSSLSQKVIPLEEAYRYRLAAVYSVLNTHLFSKREQLLAQMHRIEFRLEEVKRAKLLIERDMKSEFSGMSERLNSACGTKVAILQHDINDLESDLSRINFVISHLDSSSQDMVGFLQKASELRNSLEIAIAKPFRTDIEVLPDDLPRELAYIREMAAKYPSLQALVAFKDDLIWKLLHEKAGSGDIDSAAQQELAEWARLTDKFAQALTQYKLNCQFCGCALDEDTVNSSCYKNSGQTRSATARHFFVKAKEAPPRSSPVRQVATPLSHVPERDTDGILNYLSRTAAEKGVQIERLFKQYDVLNTGVISPTDFFQILTADFRLSATQVNSIISKYDVSKSGRIQYPLLVRDLATTAANSLDKLRFKARALLEYFDQLDVYTEGTVSQEVFKEGLRKQGLSSEEIYETMQTVKLNTHGQVLYLNFYNQIK